MGGTHQGLFQLVWVFFLWHGDWNPESNLPGRGCRRAPIDGHAQTTGIRLESLVLLCCYCGFGAIELNLAAARIDFLISSANKCIEGVPGFGFVLARRTRLLEAKGQARTLSLDLHAQWAGLESDGQLRFTPPTHVLLAFHQALLELDAEGGTGRPCCALSCKPPRTDARDGGDGL